MPLKASQVLESSSIHSHVQLLRSNMRLKRGRGPVTPVSLAKFAVMELGLARHAQRQHDACDVHMINQLRKEALSHQANGGHCGNTPAVSNEIAKLQHEQRDFKQSIQQVSAPEPDSLGSQITPSLQLKNALSRAIKEYQSQSYGVWPIIRSDVLLQQLSMPLFEEPSLLTGHTYQKNASASESSISIENIWIYAGAWLRSFFMSIMQRKRSHQPGYWVLTNTASLYKNPLRGWWWTIAKSSFHYCGSQKGVIGMVALARLFVTFDQCVNDYNSQNTLVECERLLRESEVYSGVNATRLADLSITREWMRTMIWQNALSAGYLSFDSAATSLRFDFPILTGRDLLAALRGFTSEDLLPLGRDQLLKCYEVANTLADTLLCNPALVEQSTLQFGPYDFLHGLYQKILPFLHSDDTLNSILREKTAETLLRAPSRFRPLSLPPSEDVMSTQVDPNTIKEPGYDGQEVIKMMNG
ncbi:C6 transcription factor, putative [Talaromyces stipitatus ATCC 10500]|uniref:C6 transcription factor, putative n=1 Tax=Talaromyces stipitatus (strain ATCC 10500 / CBS 375.48 / QM 6759 / NRRL 1006) TaxID=441959 RepID=B8LY98_TALSN|nr:C6 transcription factor, putative [Talaromyces stipitatus ATCC 10500]EED23343.1 C6 transcription factor, putative [Talaromyces stipitatus ATCC 10500]